MNREVVDTKVVELVFDNKDFEKNATQSISTLDKLKESLNFTDSTKGLEDINSSIKAVKFDNLTNGIQEASKGFSMLEMIGFGVFTRLGEKITDFAVNSIGKLFTFIPHQIWTGGKSRSLNMEQAIFQIEGLGKAWEDLYDDIDYAVSGTAYGLDAAAKAASQLTASGVEAGEAIYGRGNSPMAKALRGISGVAAMTGASYEEISSIFTTVAGQGRMMAGELNRIAARGLNAAQAIAEFMNNIDDPANNASDSVKQAVSEITGGLEVTEADIREFASKSLISFDIFSEAMDAAYGKHAQDANKTFAGTLTNIRAQLSKIGELFISPAMNAAIPWLNQVYNIVKNVRKIIGNSALLSGFTTFVNTVGNALNKLLGAINAPLEALANGEKIDILGAIKNIFGFDDVENAAEETADKISGSFETIRDTALKTIRGDFGNGMARMQALTEAGFDAQQIQDYVNALWEVTGHDWSKVFDEDIQKQALAMLDLTEATEDYSEKNREIAERNSANKIAMKQMTEQMSKSERVAYGLFSIWTGLSTVFGAVQERFNKIKLPKVDVFDVITTKFAEFSQGISDFLVKHADDIAAVFEGLYKFACLVGGALRIVATVLAVIGGLIIVAFGGALVLIAKAATAIYDWAAKNQILEKTISGINDAVGKAKEKISGWWKAFKEFPGVEQTFKTFGKTFTGIFTKGPKDLDRTNKAVVRFCKATKTNFKQLKDKKVSPTEFFEQIRVSWLQLANTIGDLEFVKNLKASISVAKDTINNWLTGLGTNADGTQNKFGKFYDSLTNVFGVIKENGVKALGSIKEFFGTTVVNGITNFTTKLGNLKTSFLSFPGITENINKFKTGFVSAFGNVPSFVTGAITHFKGFFGQMTTGFSKLISGEWSPKQFWDSTKLAFENVTRYFENFKGFDDFKQAVADLATSAGQWLDSLGNNADGTRNKFGLFLDKLKEIRDWIIEKLEKAKTAVLEFFSGMDITPDTLLNYFKIIKQGVSTFIGSLPDYFKGAINAFLDFFGRLKNLKDNGALTLDNILFVFKDSVGKYFKENDVFAPIKAAFSLVFEDLKSKFKEAFPGVAALISKAFEIFNNVKTILKDPTKMIELLAKVLKNLWKTLRNNFAKKFEEMGDGLGGIGKFILKHLKDLFTLDTSEIVSLLIGILVIRSLIEKLTALKEATKAAGSFGANMLKLAAAIAIIAIVVVALSHIKDPARAAVAAFGVVAVVAVLGLIMAGMAKFAGAGGGATLALVGTAFLQLSIAIGLLAIVMAALTKFEWNEFLSSAKKLAIMIGLMSVAMIALTAIGPVSLVGVGSALAFAAALAGIVWAFKTAAEMSEEDLVKAAENIALGIKAFCEKIEGVEISQESLNAVDSVGKALTGASWTAFWGAIGESIANILPGTGEDQTLLERFQASAGVLAETMQSWGETMAGIKPIPEANDAIKELSRTISDVNRSQFWSAIGEFVANLITEGEDQTLMQRFQSAASTLSTTMTDWKTTMEGITVPTEVLSKVEELRTAVENVSATGLHTAMQTFVSHILGANEEDSTVDQFANATAALAGALTTWNENMTDSDGNQITEVVTPPLDGINQLSEALKAIPGYGIAGAIAQFITGDYASAQDIENFKTRLGALAQVIDTWNTGFVDAEGNALDVSKVNEVDIDGIKNLVTAVEEIPGDSLFTRISNWLSGTTKPEEVEQFKGSLIALGQALGGYASGFVDVSVDDVKKSKSILLAFNELIEAITQGNYSDQSGQFSGIANVAQQLTQWLAPELKKFAQSMAEITNMDDVIALFNDFSALQLAAGDLSDENKVSTFVTHLTDITDAILEAAAKAFFASAGIDKLKEEVEDVNSLQFGDLSTEQARDEMKSLGKNATKETGDAAAEAVGAIKDSITAAGSDFNAAGLTLMTQVALGMLKAKATIEAAAGTITKAGKDAIRSYRDAYKSAGSYVSFGFSSGISSVRSDVVLAAERIAQAAIDKIRATIQSASPSKVTMKLGKYFGEGFVIGIDDYDKAAYNSAENLAGEARKGLYRAVKSINKILDGNIDAQPVIRPVLDLTELQNGAMTIGSLLDTTPSLALAGNLGAINASLTSRTDPNAELLNDLASLIESIGPGDTYNINGVTYDDGSNIASAVGEIVRAARVERRV